MKRIRSQHIRLFCKKLAFLLSAGIPLSNALHMICSQTKGFLHEHYKQVYILLTQGQSLSMALEKSGFAYPRYILSLIKAGEMSGKLSQTLANISDELMRREVLKKKFISMSVYPVVIAIGTILLSLFLLFYIFPKIKSVFSSLHTKLPITTRIIILISNMLHKYGLHLILFIFVSSTTLTILIKKYSSIKLSIEKIIISIPYFSRIIRYTTVSLFLRTTALLLDAHLPIHQAASTATDTIIYQRYRDSIIATIPHISSTGSIALALRTTSHIFPEEVLQLIEVGESSGSLSQNLLFSATMLDEKVENSLKITMTMLEPLLMLIMGGIVGFIALSIITPMYELSQNLNH